MPPLPSLHLRLLDDLVKQLRFAPPEAARRQLERAEELFSIVTPSQTYPEDWIVFAITGYRPEIAAPSLVMGGALLNDLGVFVELLSAAAQLTEADLAGLNDAEPLWLDAQQVCTRWKISRKTLDRYRRQDGSPQAGSVGGESDGAVLPARRVRARSGRDKLYFSIRFVREFEERRSGVLRDAASFSRIDAELAAKMVRLAAKYRQRLGWSLNQTAERLAKRFGRGHETVRQLLRRSNEAEEEAPGARVFTERGPLTDKDRRVAARAYARGVDVEAIAKRYRRTRSSIYRVLARERADSLRPLSLVDVETPVVSRPDDVMRAPSVRSGLGRPAPATLAQMIADAEADPLPDPRAERHRSGAYWILRAEAARLIAELPRHNPSAGACDEIETRLRWASRLRAELVRAQQGLVFKTIRAGLGREVATLTRSSASSLIGACIDALLEGSERFDPTKGGRLAAPVGLALNRAVTRWANNAASDHLRAPKGGGGARATSFLDPAALPLDDWTRRVDAWQRILEPDARIRRVAATAGALDARHREFLAARFGWALEEASSGPPRTIAALAEEFKLTLHHASALEHEAIAAALRAARAAEPARG